MKQLLQAALYRMYKSMGTKIAMVLIFIAASLYYVFAYLLANETFSVSQAGSITGLGDAMIIWLFGSLIVGLLVGGDFESKTIHGAVKFGRKKIVINYMLVYVILVLFMVLPYTIGSLVCIVSGADFSGAEGTVISIYMGNVLAYNEGINFGKLLLSYLAYAFVYIGQLSICVPVAIKVKKAVAVTAFGFFFGMITALLATLSSKVTILDKLYKLTPYSYNISQLGVNAKISDMLMGIVVSIGFTVLMGFISYMIFKKADMK